MGAAGYLSGRAHLVYRPRTRQLDMLPRSMTGAACVANVEDSTLAQWPRSNVVHHAGIRHRMNLQRNPLRTPDRTVSGCRGQMSVRVDPAALNEYSAGSVAAVMTAAPSAIHKVATSRESHESTSYPESAGQTLTSTRLHGSTRVSAEQHLHAHHWKSSVH